MSGLGCTKVIWSFGWCYEKKKWDVEERTVYVSGHVSGGRSKTSHKTRHYTTPRTTRPLPSLARRKRPTFGPFAQVQQNYVLGLGNPTRVSFCVVVSAVIGKRFMTSGLEYSFFAIHRPKDGHYRAWRMRQRVLEPRELEERKLR